MSIPTKEGWIREEILDLAYPKKFFSKPKHTHLFLTTQGSGNGYLGSSWEVQGSGEEVRRMHLHFEEASNTLISGKEVLAIFYLAGDIEAQIDSPNAFHYGDIEMNAMPTPIRVGKVFRQIRNTWLRAMVDQAESLGQS